MTPRSGPSWVLGAGLALYGLAAVVALTSGTGPPELALVLLGLFYDPEALNHLQLLRQREHGNLDFLQRGGCVHYCHAFAMLPDYLLNRRGLEGVVDEVRREPRGINHIDPPDA